MLAMTDQLKNLHVHFADDAISPTENANVELVRKDKVTYSRESLLKFGRSEASKFPPNIINLIGADNKRIEKIRNVLKKSDILKSLNDKREAVTLKEQSERNVRERADYFQQLITAAVLKSHQQTDNGTTRRRIGSGRIIENANSNEINHYYPIGIDGRFMRNKLFKDDSKSQKSFKNVENKWYSNNGKLNDVDVDAKSDEPEWANCGPISKHDIIELHGFDGPEGSGGGENQRNDTTLISPPARSTPSKCDLKKTTKIDEHFNFEEFLKLDLPTNSMQYARDTNNESKFTQWFGRNHQHANKLAGNPYESNAAQFFNYYQKVAMQKKAIPKKLRCVNDLEADLCPKPVQLNDLKGQQMDLNTLRLLLQQIALASAQKRPMTFAQSNYLLTLLNKDRNENWYQYRLSQNAIMKRPDAQLLLHRLVNGEISQLHLLQQINNPGVHQHDRETLMAVFAFCNENQQWLQQQQQLQLKNRERISQQLRQLFHMNNGDFSAGIFHDAMPQNNQNAIRKQFDDQYRHIQNTNGQQFKYQTNKMHSFANHSQYRSNYKKQNGMQFCQMSSQPQWDRSAGLRNVNDIFSTSMSTGMPASMADK